MSEVPQNRIRQLNDVPLKDGFVLYWSTMARRRRHNPALQRAAELAKGRGLIVLEALRADYPYACDRFTKFVEQGVGKHVDHAYFEPEPGAGKGLLAHYAKHAGCIVSDDHPGYFIPKMLQAAAKLPIRIEAVDGNGILPLSQSPGPFTSAYAFRRHVQKQLLEDMWWPKDDPLAGVTKAEVPADIRQKYSSKVPQLGGPAPVQLPGGELAARKKMKKFIAGLSNYEERNHPDADAQSGLSPYLHFGHIGAHEVVSAILRHENWTPDKLRTKPDGRRGGWGVSEAAEGFLDQIVTWRELGFTELWHNPNAIGLDTIPGWAQQTLKEHAKDPRQEVSLQSLEAADSGDPVWDAAQRQLVRDGIIHNYLRMLWGKKIIQWSPTPEEALRRMYYLNDKYALDGRDPNSVSGILWCFGKYDRAWGERPIFGKVRYMTSDSAKRKLRMAEYLENYDEAPPTS